MRHSAIAAGLLGVVLGFAMTARVSAQDAPARSDFKLEVKFPKFKVDAKGVLQAVEGTPLTMEIALEQSAYVGIFYEGDDGNVRQLFPNVFDRDHFLEASKKHSFPRSKEYAIILTPSTKTEKFLVVASTKKWTWKPNRTADAPPGVKEFFEFVRAAVIGEPNVATRVAIRTVPVWVSPNKE